MARSRYDGLLGPVCHPRKLPHPHRCFDLCQTTWKIIFLPGLSKTHFAPITWPKRCLNSSPGKEPPVHPIVHGEGDYSELSALVLVNVQNFGSRATRPLFEMNDQRLHNFYHEWRKKYRIVSWGTPMAICRLCESCMPILQRWKFAMTSFGVELCHRP